MYVAMKAIVANKLAIVAIKQDIPFQFKVKLIPLCAELS
jgi:hypothetical protein